jgi:hypothetical protein
MMSGMGMPGGAMPGMQGAMPGAMMPGMAMPGADEGAAGGAMIPSGMQGMAMPGGGMPGTPGQMGGMPGTGTRGARGRVQTPSLKQMQVIVMLERGALFGHIDINASARPGTDGFQIAMLRLRDMRPTPDASGGARRIVLTGDSEATFAMSQAAFVVESDNIAVSIRREEDAMGTQTGEITVRPGIPFMLVADVEAGVSDTEVSWNYDADNVGLPLPINGRGNAGAMPGAAMPMGAPGAMPGMGMPGMGGAMGAGTRVDATGLSAQLKFPNEEQDYRVEVTVRDRAGKKEDAKASILVRVRAAGG